MSQSLRIGFVLQNAGGVDLHRDVGDAVPIKELTRRLEKRGHTLRYLQLDGVSVSRFDSVTEVESRRDAELGITGMRPFRAVEGACRRIQRELRIPYLAAFDSWRFREACARELKGVDLLHEHAGMFCIGAALAAPSLGVPYVRYVSGDPILEREMVGTPLKPLHRALARAAGRFALGRASAVVTVSDENRDGLKRDWGVPETKVHVISNGVDLDHFGDDSGAERVRSECGLGQAPVVGFVGSFDHWHGIEDLVTAFAQVALAVPEARLLLVGHGPASDSVRRQVEAQGLDRQTVLTGHVDREEVPAFLAAMTVAVVPYPEFESDIWFSPLKLYEYAGAARPIVASDQGQIRRVLVEGESGLLFKPGSIEAMAKTILRVICDRELAARLGSGALELARRHSWEPAVDRLEALYMSLVPTGES